MCDRAHPVLAVLLSPSPPSRCPSAFRTVVGTAATARKSPPGCRARSPAPGTPLASPGAQQDERPARRPRQQWPREVDLFTASPGWLKTPRTAPALAAAPRAPEALATGEPMPPGQPWSALSILLGTVPLPGPRAGGEGSRRRGPRPGWSSSATTSRGVGAAPRVWCVFIAVGLYIAHVSF